MAEYFKRSEAYIKFRTDGVPVPACLAAILSPAATPQPDNLLFTFRNRSD
jgi:hypothetical protein